MRRCGVAIVSVVFFVFAFVFAVAIGLQAGVVRGVGLRALRRLRRVFANGSTCRPTRTGADDGAIASPHRLPHRRPGGPAYRTAHNGATLARAFGGNCAADRATHGTTHNGAVFAPYRLAYCGTGGRTGAATQNGAEVIGLGCGQQQTKRQHKCPDWQELGGGVLQGSAQSRCLHTEKITSGSVPPGLATRRILSVQVLRGLHCDHPP